MSRRYSFLHSCNHTGIGPLIRSSFPTQYHNPRPDAALQTIQLTLAFPCPFCADTRAYQNVIPGSGLLAVLDYPVSSPSTNFHCHEWRILRICRPEDIVSADWYLTREAHGEIRHMAWIPKPCGRIRVGAAEEEMRTGEMVVGRRREVECKWRQRWTEGDVVESRLSGMFSTLRKSLAEETQQGEVEDNMRRLRLSAFRYS